MADKKRFYDIGRKAMEGMIRDLRTGKPLTKREVAPEKWGQTPATTKAPVSVPISRERK